MPLALEPRALISDTAEFALWLSPHILANNVRVLRGAQIRG